MKITILTFIIIFHQFTSGYSFIGFSVPGSTSLALDSNGTCVKYTGESSECNSDERFFMEYLMALEKYNITYGEEYTHITP